MSPAHKRRPPSAASTPATPGESRPANPRRLWTFRLAAAVGVPLLCLAVLELVLRIAGVGYPSAFFLPFTRDTEALVRSNPAFARRFFPQNATRPPPSILLRPVKPAGTTRVFVLGESAALGDPLPSFGFSRYLAHMLEARHPGRRFEIHNVSMTAINSHVILPIARECSQLDADAWVIYMGNNEFVGPFGPASPLQRFQRSTRLIRAALAARSLRTAQCAEGMIQRLLTPDSRTAYWQGMEAMAGEAVPPGDDRLEVVWSHFARNLEDILGAAHASRIPVVLSTVAVNQADCPPFASAHPRDVTPEHLAAWHQAFTNGCHLADVASPTLAMPELERALQASPSHAETAYRLARLLLQAQPTQTERIGTLLQRAIDNDALRFRADSRINNIIRDAAGRHATAGVHLLDAAQEFRQRSTSGAPGSGWFYEHVHLTPAGNHLLARLTAEHLERVLGLTPPQDSTRPPPPFPTQQECEERIGFAPWNLQQARRVILDRMALPPFRGTLGNEARVHRLQADVAAFAQTNGPAEMRAQAARIEPWARRAPHDWMLRENLGLILSIGEDLPAAHSHLEAAVREMPLSASTVFSLAGVVALRGQTQEAIRLYHESIRLEPVNFHAWIRLGILHLQASAWPEAERCLRQALRAKPDSVSARMYLAAVQLKQHQPDQARTTLTEVLAIEPGHAEASNLLQRLGPGPTPPGR